MRGRDDGRGGGKRREKMGGKGEGWRGMGHRPPHSLDEAKTFPRYAEFLRSRGTYLM